MRNIAVLTLCLAGIYTAAPRLEAVECGGPVLCPTVVLQNSGLVIITCHGDLPGAVPRFVANVPKGKTGVLKGALGCGVLETFNTVTGVSTILGRCGDVDTLMMACVEP